MKKRFTRLLAMGIASLMAVSLAACGSSSGGSAGQTAGADSTAAANAGNSNVKTIKFFHRFPDDPANSFIEEKIAEYEAAHSDIDIVVTSAQNQPFKEKIKTVVGTAEEPLSSISLRILRQTVSGQTA